MKPPPYHQKNQAGPAPSPDDGASQIAAVTWVGVGVNIILALMKAVGGFWGNSRALLADAVHSLSDLATDAAVLIGVRFWSAPADREHPYGHHKIEMLVTLAIGLTLAGVGLALGWEAVKNLTQAAHGQRDVAAPPLGPGVWLALGVALSSIISKEILYRWTAARGRALGSSAVVANAWHHRSDALSSIPPSISIGAGAIGAKLGCDLWYLDPIGTIAVCLMLMKGAWDVVRPAFSPLLDATADRKLCQAIRQTVMATPGIRSAHKLRTRCLCLGQVAVDLHILVDGTITVAEGHDIAHQVKARIMNLKVEGVEARAVDVIIHIEPCATHPHSTSMASPAHDNDRHKNEIPL